MAKVTVTGSHFHESGRDNIHVSEGNSIVRLKNVSAKNAKRDNLHIASHADDLIEEIYNVILNEHRGDIELVKLAAELKSSRTTRTAKDTLERIYDHAGNTSGIASLVLQVLPMLVS